MKTYHYLLILVIICLAGCISKKEKNDPASFAFKENYQLLNTAKIAKNISYTDPATKHVEVKRIEPELNLENLIDTLWFVPLETKSNSIIGNIDKTIIADSLLFFMDSRNAKAVYIFNYDGSFLSKVNRMGKGPEEYYGISTFTVDRKNKFVMVPDLLRGRILSFNFIGNLIAKETCSFRFTDMACLDGAKFYYFRNSHNQYIFPDALDKELYAIIGSDSLQYFISQKYPNKLNYGISNQLIEYEDKVLFCPPVISNTIFELNNNSAYAKYYIDFKENTLPDKFAQNLSSNELLEEIKKGTYCIFAGLNYETQNHLYFQFTYQNKIVHAFYNRNKKKVNAFFGKYLFKDNFINTFPEIIGTIPSSDIFIGLIQPYELNDSDIHFKKKYRIDNISELNNPILCFFKIKNF